jgi:transforming growth factor-beta-induced protein
MGLNKGVLLAALLIAAMSISCYAGAVNVKSYSVSDAAKDIGSLANFSAGIKQTGLSNTLDNKGILVFGNLSFMVFAPSDSAFANVTGVDLKANETALKNVLSYHIVGGGSNFGNLTNGSSLQTLMGENLTVSTKDGLSVNGAKVLKTKKYDNGTIYEIDEVLMPKNIAGAGMDVVEAAKGLGLNTFVQAIQSTNLSDRLNGQGVLGIGALAEGPFTIFAPSDDAFAKVPAATLSAITGNKDDLRTLLSYHIVSSDSAVNRTRFNSVKTLEGSSQAVDFKAGIVGGAKIIGAKRYANGIIYEIDQVLVPMKLSIKLSTQK